jgi:choline dehydrogenase-like flavoprotein
MQYDDIIVGAGSSGAALAARLSEDSNRSVLLLEAGPDYAAVEQTPSDLLHTWVSAGPHDWGLVAKATANREIAYPRGKVTGGSSAVNGHIALRGTPEDFDEWAAWGNTEWSFDKVLPAYRKLENDRDAQSVRRQSYVRPGVGRLSASQRQSDQGRFSFARNDVFANVAIIAAGLVTAYTFSIWPDLIVGLGIAALNADAARKVWTAARQEHLRSEV